LIEIFIRNKINVERNTWSEIYC